MGTDSIMNIKSTLAAAVVLAAAPAAAISPVGFTLANSNFGDGFDVTVAPTVFNLFGSDNDFDDNLTSFSQISAPNQTISGQFRYMSLDTGDSMFDPAGYFVDGVFTQLSVDALPQYGQNFGNFSFAVNVGQSYGFYVFSADGQFGRGALTIGAIPEPSSWAMLITGFGLVGATLRRRRAVAA
jgi:hypothetical protein